MDCQKLSVDACSHAAQNDQLPLRTVMQVTFMGYHKNICLKTILTKKNKKKSGIICGASETEGNIAQRAAISKH